MKLLEKEKIQRIIRVVKAFILLVACLIPVVSFAATPRYVYLLSPEAEVVKYDLVNETIVNEIGFDNDPSAAAFIPERRGDSTYWASDPEDYIFNPKKNIMYAFIGPLAEGGTNSTLLAMQLPEWKLIKSVSLNRNYYFKASDDKSKLFLYYEECAGPVDESGDCPNAVIVDVYNAATLTKINSYRGDFGQKYDSSFIPNDIQFSNDGTNGYFFTTEKIGSFYKFTMTDSGISAENITDSLKPSLFIGSDKFAQLKDMYGKVKVGYEGKIITVRIELADHHRKMYMIEGVNGKGALMYFDITKPALLGPIIEDIPNNILIHLSDDGTRAFGEEYVETVEWNAGIEANVTKSRKLTGNIYI